MPSRLDPKGAVVVISGGAGGLGRAFGARFARAGSLVAFLDIDEQRARQAAAELAVGGAQTMGLACDVTKPAACAAAVEQIAATLGRVDVVINNAGITHRSPFAATSEEVYRRVMDVNYFGAVNLTKAALPQLLANKGRITVISSVAGFAPLLGRTGYAGAKHALHGFFGSLRAELAPAGVAVSIVCPGFTNTGIAHAALDGDGSLTSHPQSTTGRVAAPEEVAQAVFAATLRGRRLTVLSAVGKLTRLVNTLSPALYEYLMRRSLASELER